MSYDVEMFLLLVTFFVAGFICGRYYFYKNKESNKNG